MLFTSPVFLSFFLPLTLAAYFLLPFRSFTLLVLSLAFYAWGEPIMVSLLIFVIFINYIMGLAIEGDAKRRRAWLTLGIVIDVSILVVFKYTGFLLSNLNAVIQPHGFTPVAIPDIVLPLGVSFFTFQAISYLVDIYRGEVRAESNLLRMGVFKAFFPQLIAGPIVRYKEIAGDLRDRSIHLDDFSAGTERFVIGLAKKLLIADPLSIPVDRIFAMPTDDLSSPVAWIGIISFGLQIYFDFSAYSDMAIGLARMFGFHFPENFNMPYSALSVRDFWHRWHMTLSRWFRDYLYIPLGGSRHGAARTILNLWIVFATTGLWHGANWTFLLWGLWHGALLTLERTRLGDALDRAPALVRHGYTIFVVLLGWVWFRATGFGHATGYFDALFFGGFGGWAILYDLYNPYLLMALIVGGILATGAYPDPKLLIGHRRTDGAGHDGLVANGVQATARNVMLLAVAAASLCAAAASTLQAFLYFRF